MRNGGLVSWCLKRKFTVALSSTEAEYIALTLAGKKATWLHLLLTELEVLQSGEQDAEIKIVKSNSCALAIANNCIAQKRKERQPVLSKAILLKGDNQGLISLAYNPVFYVKTKHIDIQYHYIRDKIAAKRIKLSYIPTGEMIADGLTKPLTHVKFHGFIKQMSMT